MHVMFSTAFKHKLSEMYPAFYSITEINNSLSITPFCRKSLHILCQMQLLKLSFRFWVFPCKYFPNSLVSVCLSVSVTYLRTSFTVSGTTSRTGCLWTWRSAVTSVLLWPHRLPADFRHRTRCGCTSVTCFWKQDAYMIPFITLTSLECAPHLITKTQYHYTISTLVSVRRPICQFLHLGLVLIVSASPTFYSVCGL